MGENDLERSAVSDRAIEKVRQKLRLDLRHVVHFAMVLAMGCTEEIGKEVRS